MAKRDDIKVLMKEEIQKMLKDFPGWAEKDNKIFKEFKFQNFMNALSFIVKLSSFFERNDHHPDITIMYSKVKFELQRFDIGGKITNLDFMIAKEIEREYASKTT